VMPFGPTNGPATFVTMIHDVDSVWKEEAKSKGIHVGSGVDTTIIIHPQLGLVVYNGVGVHPVPAPHL
jgi:hypothetical protein